MKFKNIAHAFNQAFKKCGILLHQFRTPRTVRYRVRFTQQTLCKRKHETVTCRTRKVEGVATRKFTGKIELCKRTENRRNAFVSDKLPCACLGIGRNLGI